ncbi:flagellar basal body P-ring formation protein FlgA [Azoarcus sp. TTM-91]|uniref:flagellar basal body P-ring formation chaperone FlgA n=1 Tax=Azoarcus sp. TTM-91 TaxID=2691581 RepID=UPI00145EE5BE|nr:flagellar basal body P-ring formation chaperone FlgA [Azoarcus sp. TTM-91]NMG33165.1 flagellar basal body P-ring formation protein FlgA [Azoarcus sp. TTM-91]
MRKTSRLRLHAFPLALLPLSCPAFAQQAPEPVNRTVLAFLQQEARGLPGKVEIEVGGLDPRNQLPPCANLIPFLPAGTRAWGQISVGVRCDSPVTWTAYIQARVAVTADYLVAAQPLRAGQIVGQADIGRRRGDLAALPDNTLTDPAQVLGLHTRYAVAAGSPLRGDMLRIPHAVRQGQNVRVVSAGPGFSVSSEGRAMNNAVPGEMVRVRMPNGQVVTGTARPGGDVEIPQ